ncbi:hypothetical protein EVA_22124 [gut metagenome]|uniref:Uncharacterized protein n=1 Tax=gut metagenome TaxID=749906 RepID=J9FQX2_9ZZZZ
MGFFDFRSVVGGFGTKRKTPPFGRNLVSRTEACGVLLC